MELETGLRRLINDHAAEQCTEFEFIIRDVLTELRHICTRDSIDFDDVNKRANEVYLEECALAEGENEC